MPQMEVPDLYANSIFVAGPLSRHSKREGTNRGNQENDRIRASVFTPTHLVSKNLGDEKKLIKKRKCRTYRAIINVS